MVWEPSPSFTRAIQRGISSNYRTGNNVAVERRVFMRRIHFLIWALVGVLLAGCGSLQRTFLFYPTHDSYAGELTRWSIGGKFAGYSRNVDRPENVWLVLHGNAGQASDRE